MKYTTGFEHEHRGGVGPGKKHRHAYGHIAHLHHLRAICNRPECEPFETHDIHSVPK